MKTWNEIKNKTITWGEYVKVGMIITAISMIPYVIYAIWEFTLLPDKIEDVYDKIVDKIHKN